MNNPALSVISSADAPDVNLPFKQQNYASDPAMVSWVQSNVIPLATFVRQDRRTLETVWEEIRRLVLLQHDLNQKYIGRSKAYVPSYLRARDTMVSSLSRSLFPGDEYMDVKERLDGALVPADGAKNYIKYEWTKIANIRSVIKPYLSQFIDYGLTFAKAVYHKPLKAMTKARLKRGADRLPGVERYKDPCREGLRFSPRSNFFTYVWPTTIDSLDEAEMVFEDIDVSKLTLEKLGKANRFVNVEKVGFARQPDHDNALRQQQMETLGSGTLPAEAPTHGSFGQSVTITEVWTEMALPDSAYESDEEKGGFVPVRIHYIGDVVVSITRNPYWHQQPPYLCHRMRTFPGSFYPIGIGHAARFLQYLVNDFTNQLNDNGSFALNPIVKANLALLQGPLPGFRPGVVIPTSDPNSIVFDRPPVEQLQYGQMLVQMYMSMLQDTSGAPAILQGANAGKGARTATSAQILQGNAMNPLQDMTEDIEASTMVKLMEYTIGYGNQFRTADVLDELAGQPLKVALQDIAGDFIFNYLASSQAASQQQRAQQAMTLLQILPGVQPLLMQNGKMANPEPVLKRLFNDGFGYRGFEEFIKDAPPQAMGGAPGGPGAADAISGNAGTSPNQGAEAGPGEEAGFPDVRDNADALSAAAGAAEQGAPTPVLDVD
jgi:hypothetical protein